MYGNVSDDLMKCFASCDVSGRGCRLLVSARSASAQRPGSTYLLVPELTLHILLIVSPRFRAAKELNTPSRTHIHHPPGRALPMSHSVTHTAMDTENGAKRPVRRYPTSNVTDGRVLRFCGFAQRPIQRPLAEGHYAAGAYSVALDVGWTCRTHRLPRSSCRTLAQPDPHRSDHRPSRAKER